LKPYNSIKAGHVAACPYKEFLLSFRKQCFVNLLSYDPVSFFGGMAVVNE
jgi:hypothetical protein